MSSAASASPALTRRVRRVACDTLLARAWIAVEVVGDESSVRCQRFSSERKSEAVEAQLATLSSALDDAFESGDVRVRDYGAGGSRSVGVDVAAAESRNGCALLSS